ncbi:SURF1 family cytochrome oxidase biogenesis protein [Cellulosimicrobium marinum]|uniref:SURF1 family cytochrome oxidase biogenesis protein n=1 Tax=Cellulosimicrobium marinum TaxID=1638992 RepID=UPI001E494F9F|nr:SURF1 family protein [Cellulosimicrobium marinum]MCB7137283.1 SURF1 family protein [Cellulosimicrobium marinum]
MTDAADAPVGPRAANPTYEPRTPRQWATLAVGVVVLVALCLVAGRWQWNRYVDREAEIAQIEANYTAAPAPVSQVLPAPGSDLDPAQVWLPVTLEGRYEPDGTVLLRNRPVGGSPGFHVLVPFVTDPTPGAPDGLVVVVDRGFVPLGTDAVTPGDVPDPPTGTVEATVTLRADEPASDRDAPAGQVQAISTDQVLAAGAEGGDWAAGRTVGAYGQLRDEVPAPDVVLEALPKPDTDPGSHLSYAFQWGVFALGAVAGFWLLVRRDRRDRRGEDVTLTAGDLLAAEDPGSARPRRDPRTRRPTAEDEEDALIDAQLDPRTR